MKTKARKILGILLTVCLTVGIFAGVWLGLSPEVEAVAATQVTLIDDGGTTITLNAAVSEETYEWDPTTSTLTLNGWSGKKINGNGDFNLRLKDINTIQMEISELEETYGLGANPTSGSMGTITVTADEDGTLNILGDLKGANGTAIHGVRAYTVLLSGKLNIDITSDGYGHMYGMWGTTNLVDQTDGVDLDVRMESTYDGTRNFSIYGLYNSGLYYQPIYGAETAPQNVTVDVSVKGPQKAAVYAIGDIYIHSGSGGLDPDIDIVAVANNDGSTERGCFAVHGLRAYYVGKNATLDCTGMVRSGSLDSDFYFDGHTQSTAPADNKYIWSVEDPEAAYLYFIATDYAGVPLEKFVLAYNETLPDLEWKGEDARITGGKIGENSAELYLLPYIKGASSYRTSDWTFQLKAGSALPEGLTLYSNGGSITGSATQACEAGEVTIVATDRMGTPSDSADDRTLEFTVAYDAWVEPDRFLQVGSDPQVEIRENGSGTGWSYDGTTKILTLDGYHGGPIQSEWDLHIHLVGENTITMVDESNSKGIFIDNYKSLLISAAEDGKLNIVGELTHDYFYAIYGYLTVQGGKLNVDVDATFGSNYQGYGIWGGLTLTDESQNVEVNVNIGVEGTGSGRVHGIYNGSLYYSEEDDSVTYPSATVSVNVTGTEDVAVEAFGGINIRSANADIDIVAVASNNTSETKSRYAVNDLGTFDVGPKVTLDCTGWVRRGDYTGDWVFNGHMQTTTPENNTFVWKRDEDTVNDPYPYFTMYKLDGSIVEEAVFAYKEDLGELKWTGNGFISVPGAILGESFYGTDLLSGILNGSHYYASYNNTWSFVVTEGSLPEGLNLHSSEGLIYGSRNHVYSAGTVTICATDKNCTEDPSDDRSVTFTVPYGAVQSNNPVTGVTLNKDSLILEYDGSGDVTATVTPSDAAYPNVKGQMAGGNSNLYTENISTPENGVSVVTIRANNFVGKATFYIITVDMGYHQELTVYVREKAPEISIDYRNEELEGFSAGRTYIVTVDGGAPTEIAPEGYAIDIREEWIGKTVSIVLKHDGEANCNSPAQELAIPARPAAPTPGKTDASGAEAEDGSITGVTSTMEYKQESQDSWSSIYSDTVNYLGVGTYHVRYRSTDTALASQTATVVIGYGELTFADSASFDILGGETETAVSIDVSTGVSGGKKPYVYSIEGPTWLSINAETGVISGTRPNSEQAATTATVTVTDADSVSESITINVGQVVLPHVHVYDQERVEETYRAAAADCLNAALYHYSCVCGDKGGDTFTYGTKLGHDYTERIEDEMHLKQEGANCQQNHVYWYDCSRCGSNAKDDPAATEMFYSGTAVGAHDFDTETWGYKGEDGHAHVCKAESCQEHDTPVAHTPGDEATEFAPQLCTVCSYEI
ncbi:MAG: putative Ig domain-containing protein, partial [Clostridia bacterium]|nr:putative Ig domain-containing protein [Clostridia bacterium]